MLDLASFDNSINPLYFSYVFEDKINVMGCVAIISDMKLYIYENPSNTFAHYCIINNHSSIKFSLHTFLVVGQIASTMYATTLSFLVVSTTYKNTTHKNVW